MPRTGDNYSLPYSPVESGTPIESLEYNGTLADIATDLNAPRPVVAGGSGASTVDGALDNLSAEKFKQVVTNWDATAWRAGSFYAATTAIGSAPVASHAFAGIVYYRNATDLVIEANDVTDPLNPQPWVRIQEAGAWGNWMLAPGSASSKKNYIINGAMMISQEYGMAPLSTVNQYPADMFNYAVVNTPATVSFGQVQVGTPGGSTHRIRITVTGTDVTQDAGDFAAWQTAVEGYRYADLWAGQTPPKQVTLRFGVNAPEGTYCVAFRNYATTRSYVAEYTIEADEDNIDVVKTVTLPATDGTTFEFSNSPGIYITWAFICGSTRRTTPNGWRTGNYMGTANQYNFMGTGGNVFELFDVGLYEGSIAPPFVVPDYAGELASCRRYYYKRQVSLIAYSGGAAAPAGNAYTHPVQMRAPPAVTNTPGGIVNGTGGTTDNITSEGFRFYVNATGAGNVYIDALTQTASARL